jgi:hypothetical protein
MIMPAKGYQYFEVVEFPSWEISYEFRTIHQEPLFSDFDAAPQTIITSVGLADYQQFTKYHVLHETYQKVRGRYKNEQINGYVAQLEFHIYFHTEHHRLLIDAPRSICKELVDRVEKSQPGFNVIPREIDLIKLGNDLKTNVRGGWFGDLKVADVSTIGIFGPTVGESEEWDKYGLIGKLKAVDLELDWNGQNLLVKIMANRGIVHFETLTEYQSLERVLNIHNALDDYELHEGSGNV